jgi:hypothetical protein
MATLRRRANRPGEPVNADPRASRRDASPHLVHLPTTSGCTGGETHPMFQFEFLVPSCSLRAVNVLSRVVWLSVLALWGLAAMHCNLETLPGMEFLRSCCFVDSSTASHNGCEGDGCEAVENAKYLPGQASVSVPQPALFLALGVSAVEAPLPKLRLYHCTNPDPDPPPDLSKAWQFSFRTALPPRAPSFIG